ncbi:hypothetical protein BZL29_4546 [Mycobacterium kansasii]|uniref:Uncharacterized protein n=1 Tax=Mycobacterium kansasii TaxID=1768 RepID=A0A1V3X6B8_MYCKA|nr:hypothetical protein BZL29_4546 [Mycobacterium kansasii]
MQQVGAARTPNGRRKDGVFGDDCILAEGGFVEAIQPLLVGVEGDSRTGTDQFARSCGWPVLRRRVGGIGLVACELGHLGSPAKRLVRIESAFAARRPSEGGESTAIGLASKSIDTERSYVAYGVARQHRPGRWIARSEIGVRGPDAVAVQWSPSDVTTAATADPQVCDMPLTSSLRRIQIGRAGRTCDGRYRPRLKSLPGEHSASDVAAEALWVTASSGQHLIVSNPPQPLCTELGYPVSYRWWTAKVGSLPR